MRTAQVDRFGAKLRDLAGQVIARGTVELEPFGVWERFTIKRQARATEAVSIWVGTRAPIGGEWWLDLDGGNVSAAALAGTWPGHEPPGIITSRRPPWEVALVVETSAGPSGWDVLLCPVRQRVRVAWEDDQGVRMLGETYRFAVVKMRREVPPLHDR